MINLRKPDWFRIQKMQGYRDEYIMYGILHCSFVKIFSNYTLTDMMLIKDFYNRY